MDTVVISDNSSVSKGVRVEGREASGRLESGGGGVNEFRV